VGSAPGNRQPAPDAAPTLQPANPRTSVTIRSALCWCQLCFRHWVSVQWSQPNPAAAPTWNGIWTYLALKTDWNSPLPTCHPTGSSPLPSLTPIDAGSQGKISGITGTTPLAVNPVAPLMVHPTAATPTITKREAPSLPAHTTPSMSPSRPPRSGLKMEFLRQRKPVTTSQRMTPRKPYVFPSTSRGFATRIAVAKQTTNRKAMPR
jgi:hypothetical protein